MLTNYLLMKKGSIAKMENNFMKNINYKIFDSTNETNEVLITIHGFAGDSDSSVIYAIANEITKHNFSVIAFDLPNHGKDKTVKNLTLANCINYLKIIVDFVRKKYKNKPISFFATSFGAYILLNYLSQNNLKFNNVILRAPAIFMDNVLVSNILQEHGFTIDDLMKNPINLGFNKDLMIDKNFLQELKNNNLSTKHFSFHIDIIQGDKDDVVNVIDNEHFFKTNFSDYSLFYIKNANHRFKNPGDVEQILQLVKNILKIK